MRFFKISSVFSVSITLGTSLALAQSAPASKPAEATIPAAKVSATSQTQKPVEMILVAEGELYRTYRALTHEELNAAAEKKAAWQAEIEEEKLRIVEILLVDQIKATQEKIRAIALEEKEAAPKSESARELEAKKAS